MSPTRAKLHLECGSGSSPTRRLPCLRSPAHTRRRPPGSAATSPHVPLLPRPPWARVITASGPPRKSSFEKRPPRSEAGRLGPSHTGRDCLVAPTAGGGRGGPGHGPQVWAPPKAGENGWDPLLIQPDPEQARRSLCFHERRPFPGLRLQGVSGYKYLLTGQCWKGFGNSPNDTKKP